MSHLDPEILIAVAEQARLYEPLARQEGDRIVLWPPVSQHEHSEWED